MAARDTQHEITEVTAFVPREGARLACRLRLPAGKRPPCVVFVHGLGSGKDSPRNVVIAERLLDAGIGALLFDLSGHGESTADPRGAVVDAYVDDLTAVYRWLMTREDIDSGRIGVAGSSLGAMIALEAVRSGGIAPGSLVLRAPPVSGDELRDVAVPALLIIGSRDPLLFDVREAPRSRAVQLEVVEGAGHLFEEPGALERVLDVTIVWFRGALSPPGT